MLPINGYICMRAKNNYSQVHAGLDGLHLTKPIDSVQRLTTKQCRDGSFVQSFHRCSWGDDVVDDDIEDPWSVNGFSLFPCRYGPPVHYSLVCDGKGDCADSSDELGCQPPQFPPLTSSRYVCKNLQIIPASKYCDVIVDCYDESDEEHCSTCHGAARLCPHWGCVYSRHLSFLTFCSMSHAFNEMLETRSHVTLDGYGLSTLVDLAENHNSCAEGFYQCQDSYCIPTFLLNNGEKDCPMGEDEHIPWVNLTCPGYYRCQTSGNCVHRDYVCDGVIHCPYKDDELFCQLTCLSGCVCEGLAVKCSITIDPLQHLQLRYLDLSHVLNVSLDNAHVMEYLLFLNLSGCNLHTIRLQTMPKLSTLDLSHNTLTNLSLLTLSGLSGLKFIDLSHNHFAKILGKAFTDVLNTGQLKNLETLKMNSVGFHTMGSDVWSPLMKLNVMDIRNNAIKTYEKNSLRGLPSLDELYTDASKLCCPYFHSHLIKCHAPKDALSSCDDLLAQDFFRVFLWIFSTLAIVGNGGVFVYSSKKKTSSFQILVRNLCVADFVMGVYMLMIGVADAVYGRVYVEKEKEWTQSLACTAAGFLSLLSSEASAFAICLITLDRVLVICFPFNKRCHLGRRSTLLACSGVWVMGVVLAAVPLLAGLEFYGQNGICVPLPITRQEFSGQTYAFSVFVCLNFVFFICICTGQLVIYVAVQKAGSAVRTNHSQRDMALARRLSLVVLTDFLCWFPVSVIGLLVLGGIAVPDVVSVWVAIFVLPFNSALNPFLYTLSSVLEQWKRRRLEERAMRMLGTLQTEIPKWSPSKVEQLVKICVRSKLVGKRSLAAWMGLTVVEPNVLAEDTTHVTLQDGIDEASSQQE